MHWYNVSSTDDDPLWRDHPRVEPPLSLPTRQDFLWRRAALHGETLIALEIGGMTHVQSPRRIAFATSGPQRPPVLVVGVTGVEFGLLIPISEFVARIPPGRADLIVLSDVRRQRFLHGIDGMGHDLAELLDGLAGAVEASRYERVRVVAACAGTVGGLAASRALGADRLVLLSPFIGRLARHAGREDEGEPPGGAGRFIEPWPRAEIHSFASEHDPEAARLASRLGERPISWHLATGENDHSVLRALRGRRDGSYERLIDQIVAHLVHSDHPGGPLGRRRRRSLVGVRLRPARGAGVVPASAARHPPPGRPPQGLPRSGRRLLRTAQHAARRRDGRHRRPRTGSPRPGSGTDPGAAARPFGDPGTAARRPALPPSDHHGPVSDRPVARRRPGGSAHQGGRVRAGRASAADARRVRHRASAPAHQRRRLRVPDVAAHPRLPRRSRRRTAEDPAGRPGRRRHPGRRARRRRARAPVGDAGQPAPADPSGLGGAPDGRGPRTVHGRAQDPPGRRIRPGPGASPGREPTARGIDGALGVRAPPRRPAGPRRIGPARPGGPSGRPRVRHRGLRRPRRGRRRRPAALPALPALVLPRADDLRRLHREADPAGPRRGSGRRRVARRLRPLDRVRPAATGDRDHHA